MPQTYDLIATTTLTGTSTDVTFSGLTTAYNDFVIVFAGFGSGNDFNIFFNGDTNTANYSRTYVRTSTSTVAGGRNANSTFYPTIGTGVSNGNKPDLIIVDVFNATQSSTYKTGMARRTAGNGYELDRAFGTWRNTAAITSITLNSTTFQTGSIFSIYGIKRA
jgi:hypothetical protein